ncbi:MAG: universal stress protein [Thermogemmatispora sp.]|uniref:universal stress protein n=1 Tax=Thermogemmatispora sp. TaxID=1968838 RepID=UPI002605FAEB|nr:universal stress protein [Thermogemmatispora sp.]MBX5459305.1 universal stress protein [Thermogemmatispora sp.]
MFRRILVPLDGTPAAERALLIAAHLARPVQGSISVLRVIEWPPPGVLADSSALYDPSSSLAEQALAQAGRYLNETVQNYAQALERLPVEQEVAFGPPASTVCSAAQLEQTDLIILCTHAASRLKRWIVGSMAQQAVRRSPAPLLVFHEQGPLLPFPRPERPLRLLLPLDGSPVAEAALRPAFQLLAQLVPPELSLVQLLRVIDISGYGALGGGLVSVPDLELPEQLQEEARNYVEGVVQRVRQDQLANPAVTITSAVTVGSNVSEAILEHATAEEERDPTQRFDLIALATHGRTGLARFLLGSVTEQLLAHSRLPLFIVRPGMLREEEDPDEQAKRTGEEQRQTADDPESTAWTGLL